ncbi:glycoside hydrolase family 3 N-terminal domain-containing protein [Sphingomonas canadensis]|uniref:Glycoside hydrolase family 3 N-terminal domain-containing protein n=1 Tax=Sphingomonas canadensis TaxID=1219257 RepID=A0ABW3HCA1_9SPHN|nr:glycoside hydrolase family 3 protein [Sphingomonas canadensis]MCW3838226.1 exo 1,3/1,4-beta-D-glucan glucohydrolase [Sphingomonas canadensis]
MRLGTRLLLATTMLGAASVLAAQETPAPTGPTVADPANWPAAASAGLVDPETEKFIDGLLAKMTLEQKIGQMIQADIAYIKPEDLRTYPLGSILAGGNSPPLSGDDRSSQKEWVDTARAFRAVAMEDRPGNLKIPLIFGIDAVHGNANVVGATVFPHNVGLGAMRDPALIRRIGEVTAVETAASGIDWAFGPTVTVPQNDRWGRAYEGYSEDPEVVRSYAGAMVEGLQGVPGTTGRIQKGFVAASAKHFLGDGGTTDGIDQGDTRVDEATLARVHAAGYPPAINAGTMTVMASYNSWNGAKMHGNQSLLTGVLKGRMGFQGFVVGDWNGHGQIPGCTATDCPQTFIAGLDMAMAPDSWKGLFDSTLRQAKDGTIPMARIDDAVRRILRVKVKLGLFDPARPIEGKAGVMGAPEHRAVAREAVAKSLVLLKNNGVLPLKASANVLVAGPGADSMGMQTGGWTLSWQGDGNANSLFPGGTTIFAGIADAVKAGGGSATLSEDGSFKKKPDVAIVVFGEQPYAEMRGDIRTLEFQPGDKQALATLKKLKAAGIPTVSVFLSGRPLWVNPELNASDAFVAAWLPGSEGAGVADVLVGDAAGKPRRDFTGTLSFSWPKAASQFVLNRGDAGYDPLFPFGYGLSYARPGAVGALSEEAGIDASAANVSTYFARGITPAPWSFATDSKVTRKVVEGPAQQEGAVQLTWPAGPATVRIGGGELDLTREANGDLSLQISYKLDRAATGPVKLLMEGGANTGAIDATGLFSGATGQWKTVKIFLKCYRDAGVDLSKVAAPFVIQAAGPLQLSIADVRIVSDPNASVCPGK